MILELLGASLAALAISALGHVLLVAVRNREKYKFFERMSPNLPVLSNPSLFGGHSNQLCYAKYQWALGEKYLKELGPTFGFFLDNRPAVLTTDLDFIKTFIVDEPIHNNRIHLNLPVKELEDDCIMFAEDDQWLRLRRAIAPAFSAYRIKSANVLADINGIIDKLVNMIESRFAESGGGEGFIEMDAEDMSQRYALALVFTNFYKQDDVVDFGVRENEYVQMMDRYARDIVNLPIKLCAAFPILRDVLDWFISNFHEQGRFRNKIREYIRQQTRANFEANKQLLSGMRRGDVDNFTLEDGSKFRRNMIDYVTDRYREGKLTKSEYFNSVLFLFIAAEGTTSDATSRLFFNLAKHPRVQEKLRKSLLDDGGVESEYLTWCVNETLRLHPPAPVGCSRSIKRDIHTKHGLVPAGTIVVTPARTIHRLREYWGEDADDFRPERWANAKDFHPCQFVAFGGGRRACPGRELALMEIKMLAYTLLRRYSFERSHLHPIDNSDHFDTPMFVSINFDTPTYVRIRRLDTGDK